MRKLIDLAGEKFGKLTVIKRVPSNNGRTYWLCRCECGNNKVIESYHLQHHEYISCGCIKKPNPKKINMVNKVFGSLTVIREAPNPYKRKHTSWECICECGNKIIAEGTLLRRGYYSSCGCKKAERISKTMFKHGKTNTRIYKIWHCMRQRCNNPNYYEAHLYYERGIKICPEWDNFENFYKWAMENGYKENLSIDRIDVNGNYEPSNCRWATDIEQANNRRNNHYLVYNGEKHTLSEWARIINMNLGTLKSRLKLGWSVEEAFTKPIRVNKRWYMN